LPITLRAIISRLLRHCDDLEHTAEFRSKKK
jgi:hypothetical protein